MAAISEEDRANIAKAIEEAETQTSAEIICVAMRASGDYWSTPFLWAAAFALIWPWPLISITTLTAWTIWITQLLVFAAVALVLSIPQRRRLSATPPWIKKRRARQAAREHFHTQGLHRTVGRSGVLIFVSEAEGFAEVLADDSVSQKIGDSTWRPIAQNLLGGLARGEGGAAIAAAVKEVGAVLAREMPPRANERNELPDKVIVI